MRDATFALAIGLALTPATASAQVSCAGGRVPWTLDGPRLLERLPDLGALRRGTETLGSACLESSAAQPSPEGPAPTPASLRISYRSAYPVDRNNGFIWEGRGLSTVLSGGLAWRTHHFRAVLAPAAGFQQNRTFPLRDDGQNAFAYPFHNLDWPQRMGAEPFWSVDPGESTLEATAGAGVIGVGTENLWWGPARRYPLLLSNTAGGAPHVHLGLARPVWIGVGTLRVQGIWARLDASRYFDQPEPGRRLLTGVFLEYRPSGLPGLTLGVAGVQHNKWEDASKGLNLFTFAFRERENTTGNGLLSLTASWSMPESEFEAYGEFGREDYWADLADLLSEPGHSAAYTLGFEKVSRSLAVPLRLMGEITNLGAAQTVRSTTGVGRVTWYEHATLTAGHTARGQLLGSWIGPGSDAQYLGVDAVFPHRLVGAYVERVRRDEDAYKDHFAPAYSFRGHDLEWTVGLQGDEGSGPFVLRWDVGISRRRNRGFIGLDGVNRVPFRETNACFTLTTFWLPGS